MLDSVRVNSLSRYVFLRRFGYSRLPPALLLCVLKRATFLFSNTPLKGFKLLLKILEWRSTDPSGLAPLHSSLASWDCHINAVGGLWNFLAAIQMLSCLRVSGLLLRTRQLLTSGQWPWYQLRFLSRPTLPQGRGPWSSEGLPTPASVWF